MSADSLILAPYGVDPLSLLAHRLLERHASELPDLGRHVALFPQPTAASRFRAALLTAARARGFEALLPPWIGTLSTWLGAQAFTATPLTPAARELVFLEALAPFSGLVERFGPWSLIDGVFPLFDELTHNPTPLTVERAAIHRLLVEGYGAREPFAPIEQEADWIVTLWRTWSEHLARHGWHDAPLAQQAAFAQTLAALPAGTHIYVAADLAMPATERRWLHELIKRDQLTLLLQGQATRSTDYHPDRPVAVVLNGLGLSPPPAASTDAYGELLDNIFRNDGAPLGMRAHEFAAHHPRSPAHDRLALYIANDLEQEAQAVELQVRRWLIAGARDVAIVTPDRKLARRVRALLERANVALADYAGWALSTTSAATALARWLECCERHFAYAPLLDFLKSPFVSLGMDSDSYARAVRSLEHDIIRRHGIRSGLGRYLATWRRRTAAAVSDAGVDRLLERLAHAAEPIQRLLRDADTHTPAAFLDAIHDGMERLSLLSPLQHDLAGRELLAILDHMRSAPTLHRTRLTYASFRRWLERELERRRFRPPAVDAHVRLLSAPESSYCQFDAITIAGCTADQMPGKTALPPFFNETIRRNLGLPAAVDRMSQALYDFRRLLQAAPKVLLSYRRHEGREPKLPSPWIQRLTAFHQAAYGPIDDDDLSRLLRNPATRLAHREQPLPTAATMPTPRVPPTQLPTHWTASAHQRLLDCPFQFYTADVLRLVKLDVVPEEIERSHYGERVHRILHAFHHGLPGLPGPWTGPLTDATRAEAERLLDDIARAVFAGEIQEHFSSRAWLYHWQAIIPAYIDWWGRHCGAGCQVAASEVKVERTIYIDNRPLVLKGRIDRIDDGPNGKVILDYKTGQVPDPESTLNGEQCQLGFYTLLIDTTVEAAMFVGLRESPVKTEPTLTGTELLTLRNQLTARILSMASRLAQGATLPAWGDRATCDRCCYEGVCRKDLWVSDARQQ